MNVTKVTETQKVDISKEILEALQNVKATRNVQEKVLEAIKAFDREMKNYLTIV